MAAAKNDHLLTSSEVADLFRVSTKTVNRWAQAGLLPSFRTVGSQRRFRASEIRSLFSPGEWAGIVDVTDTRPEIIDVRERLGIKGARTSETPR